MTELVRDLMHRGLYTCQMETTLGEVAVLLIQHHVHAIFVEDDERKPVGIVTDFDLLTGEWLSIDAEALEAMRKMTAGELMTSPLDSIDGSQPIGAAASRMQSGNIHRLVVTEEGEPVGVISISDIIASMASRPSASSGIVADVMSHPILTCRKETKAGEIARTITELRSRSVLVVDDAGRPLGVVTKFDLLRCCTDTEDALASSAEAIMNPALTIGPDASLREAANSMINHHYHRLVVVDPERPDAFPVGIISSYDIVNEMARPDSAWKT